MAGALVFLVAEGCGKPSTPAATAARRAIDNLRSPDPQTRASAARRLGELKFADAVPQLIRTLVDPEQEPRIEAIVALGEIGGERAVDPLHKVLRSSEWIERKAGADALRKVKDARSIAPLLSVLGDEHSAVAAAAAQALVAIGQPATPPLIETGKNAAEEIPVRHAALAETNAAVKTAAANADAARRTLERLQGPDATRKPSRSKPEGGKQRKIVEDNPEEKPVRDKLVKTGRSADYTDVRGRGRPGSAPKRELPPQDDPQEKAAAQQAADKAAVEKA
ncbi:MAG: HEAT repeat domain-containing protein, partial [Tepidisphaeraceae bacterium]